MNKNHFTLLTRWRDRNKTVPERINCTTKLMRFAVLLCICFFGREMNAQCVDCTAVNSLNTDFDCIEAIPTAEEILIINPNCLTNQSAFSEADVDVPGTGTGALNSPRVFDRTYTFDPDGIAGNGDEESCTIQLTLEQTGAVVDFDAGSCPGDFITAVGANQCGQAVFFNAPTLDNLCEGVEVIQTAGLASGELFPIGVTTVEFSATANGTVITCDFEVTVNPFTGGSNNLICNSNISADVGSNCEVIITPDGVLEGSYGCDDEYTVSIVSGITPVSAITSLGSAVSIDVSQLTLTNGVSPEFQVMVTENATGLSCMGSGWTIKDASIPTVCCTDYEVSCTNPTAPLSLTGITKTYETNNTPTTIEAIDLANGISFTQEDVNIEVPDCDNAVVSLQADFDFTTTSLADFQIDLIAPDGTSQTVLPAGSTQLPTLPLTLNNFVGTTASGTWTVRVVNTGATTATLESFSIEIGADYANPVVADVCGNSTLESSDVVSGTTCGGDRQITRTWTATGPSGMTSSCVQTITFSRPAFIQENIGCPNNRIIQCDSGFDTDINGNPAPLAGDFPTIDGSPVDGTCDFFFFLSPDGLPYTDQVVAFGCPGNIRYKRTWMIADGCPGGGMLTCEQIIDVVDTEGPAIVCPGNFTTSVGSNCEASVILPLPVSMTDACSNNNNTFTATATGGGTLVQMTSGAYSLIGLGRDEVATVAYTPVDECGNAGTPCTFTVTAIDNIAPGPVCDFQTVALSGGSTEVMAIVFDDGSTDNCEIVSYEARKLSECGTPTPNAAFGPSVTFQCCEAAGTVEVELRLTDASGNSNICSGFVTVQNNLVPTITCPAGSPMTIECSNQSALDNYAGVGDTDTGIEAFFENDAGVEEFIGYYDDELISMGCFARVVITETGVVNTCGEGTITRTYTAENSMGGSNSCQFVINVVDSDPFDVDADWVEPADMALTVGANCALDISTDNTGTPNISKDEGCDNIAEGFDDLLTFVIEPEDGDACYKIIRTWTVTDWCAQGGSSSATKVQVIKVTNSQPPTITCSTTDPIVVDEGESFSVSATATSCVPLDDADDDGITITYQVAEGSGTFGIPVIGDNLNTTTGVNTAFPPGDYTIRFTATDRCGNVSDCSIAVTVNDVLDCNDLNSGTIFLNAGSGNEFLNPDLFFGVGGAPSGTTANVNGQTIFTCNDIPDNIPVEVTATITLPNNVVCNRVITLVDSSTPNYDCVSAIPLTGVGTVNLEDYQDLLFPGLNDNCTPLSEINLTYDPPTISCGSNGNPVVETVTLTATDNFDHTSSLFTDGNPRVCVLNVEISCSTPQSSVVVSGSIANEQNQTVENVTVSPLSGMNAAMTNLNGTYSMDLPTSENYEVTPQKDDDHLNGVSTYDLVLISKHILQTEELDSPYKLIAADINKSGGITTLDMVELRKVILFINEEFPNNESWRFVDADYAFPNPTNPFEEVFPEDYVINGLNNDMNELDFVAVKIGDVNGTAVTNGFTGGAGDRTFNGELNMEMNEVKLSAGQSHDIEVKAKDFNNMLGYQFTMAFEGLEVMEVVPGELTGLTAANFGMQRVQDGLLTTSWNNNEAISLADDAVLFTVKVKATTDIALSEALHASSQYTAAEAYADKAGAVELLEVNFNFRDANGATITNAFELYQNRPNPFKNQTIIGFDLPQTGAATIAVYDLSGKVLTQIEGTYEKGYNEVSINRSDLPAAGVLYYELSTADDTAVRKMTIIE